MTGLSAPLVTVCDFVGGPACYARLAGWFWPAWTHLNANLPMKRIVLFVVLAILGWKTYQKNSFVSTETKAAPEPAISNEVEPEPAAEIDIRPSSQARFTCDGRVYCSEMKSCDEAKYFLDHCPGVKMDGDHDGIPCEQQWCS